MMMLHVAHKTNGLFGSLLSSPFYVINCSGSKHAHSQDPTDLYRFIAVKRVKKKKKDQQNLTKTSLIKQPAKH
jgi:hypothetical protein